MINLSDSRYIELRNNNSVAKETAEDAVIKQRKEHIDLKYNLIRDSHFTKRVSLSEWPKSS